jgi:hypothetical protein
MKSKTVHLKSRPNSSYFPRPTKISRMDRWPFLLFRAVHFFSLWPSPLYFHAAQLVGPATGHPSFFSLLLSLILCLPPWSTHGAVACLIIDRPPPPDLRMRHHLSSVFSIELCCSSPSPYHFLESSRPRRLPFTFSRDFFLTSVMANVTTHRPSPR